MENYYIIIIIITLLLFEACWELFLYAEENNTVRKFEVSLLSRCGVVCVSSWIGYEVLNSNRKREHTSLAVIDARKQIVDRIRVKKKKKTTSLYAIVLKLQILLKVKKKTCTKLVEREKSNSIKITAVSKPVG